MKKILLFLLALSMVFPVIGAAAAEDTLYIFAAPDGNDSNPGTFAAPVATLKKACELASASASAVITLKGGTYKTTEKAKLNGAKNITIKSHNNEKVTFTGAEKLNPTLFEKVTDTAVLERIVEKNAREKIVSIDMKAAGVDDLGEINMYGFDIPGSSLMPQLIVDNKFQTLARYPDNGYMIITEVVDEGPDRINSPDKITSNTLQNFEGEGFSIRTDDARFKNWTQANDVWAFGYFRYDWAENALPCTIDFKNNIFKSNYPCLWGVSKNQRFYCFNLLEEISVPGEFYIDRETGIMYLYPQSDINGNTDIEFINFKDNFLTITDSENIKIDGITFENSLEKGITVKNSRNIDISDCGFEHIIGTVIDLAENVCNCTVADCTFTEIGAMGVNISETCGDRTTLTPGNCAVENCVFKGIQRIRATQAPAINLRGVSNRASHNEISDSASIAIWFGGNDHIIEYNNIYDVCKDTADTGAVYGGADWAARGNEIRYNYIHDISLIDNNTGMNTQAIYLDDLFSSAKVYGNIIENVSSIALYGGGRYNTFENNIAVNCKKPFVFDARGTTWQLDLTKEGGARRTALLKFPYNTGIWAEKYPELSGILNDEPELPKHNTIKNNIFINSAGMDLDESVIKYGTVENNTEDLKTDIFTDYKSGDLTLKENSSVSEKLPDFKAIDFKSIGVQEKTAKEKSADAILSSSVILKLNTASAYVFGNKTSVDSDNPAVMPKIINDRTLVPVRFIAESLGGEVSWNDAKKKVGITLNGKTIELVLGKAEISVNGRTNTLDVPAQSIEGRTMLPLRAVTEALGMDVFWDNSGLIVVSGTEILTENDNDIIASVLELF